jgi:lysophospholipase
MRFTHILTTLVVATMPLTSIMPANPKPSRCGPSGSSQTVTAQVVQSNSLCKQELDAFASRQAKAHVTLGAILNQQLDPTTIPTIGVACSGGGFRAALAALGLMRGLTAIGLMDAVTYWAALSGSTWSTAGWMYRNTNLDEFTTYLQNNLSGNNAHDKLDKMAMLEAMVRKYETGRPCSANDIWGSIIANTVLRSDTNNGQSIPFASLAPNIINGTYPIPLFTNIIGETESNYQWFETSPFVAGSTYLNTWIPTTAFGKKFNAGASEDPYPAETLGFILGMCGSAYALSMPDIIDNLDSMLEDELASCGCWPSRSPGKRLSPPVINNPTYNLQGAPLSSKKTITLVDAGISEINLPFPPLLRRNVQVYIVCDADSDNNSTVGNVMHFVEAWARKNGYTLPDIDYQALTTQDFTLLTSPQSPQTPIIIYIPNRQSFSTLKFSYTNDEFNRLVGGIENAVINNSHQIYQAIGLAVANKETLARQKNMAKVK